MWIDNEILRSCQKDLCLKAFTPGKSVVVLGRSNKAELEVKLEACQNDSIEVLRRLGGGGTVILYDGCVVVSIGMWLNEYYQNSLFFSLINQSIIDCLSLLNPEFSRLSQRGLSDICFGEKKIAGTSLYRSRNYLLYQASFLIHADFEKIKKYLCHPSKEPEYRQNRPHEEFLTGLSSLDPQLSTGSFAYQINNFLEDILCRKLANHMIKPIESQIDYLIQKTFEVEGDG